VGTDTARAPAADPGWADLARVAAREGDEEAAFARLVESHQDRLLRLCERMLGGHDGGQELQLARDGCAAGADGPDGGVLRAVGGLLEQIEGRADRDPLRQLRTPGFDLALVAATVARTPDAPVPALGR